MAGDPLLSMSLKSLEQLLAGSSGEQDRALPSLLERLQRQISSSADVSPAQLVTCLQLLCGVDAPRLLALVAPRAAAAAGRLAPQELVNAARALAHCAQRAATADLARALGTVMAEALCRHRGLSLEQLAALAASPAPRRGVVLQALLLHAEVDRPPDDSPEDEDAALAAALDRLADQASSLAPEDLVLSLAGLAVLAVRDDLAAAVLCEDLAARLPALGSSELALLSWALGTLGLRCEPVMEALAKTAQSRIWRFGPGDLVKLIFGFVAVGLRHWELLDAVAEASSWSLSKMTPSGLAQLSWSFATLGVPKQELMAAIALQVAPQVGGMSEADLATVAWSFASLRLRHGRLMHSIAKEAASRLADFDEEDLARLAWAYATLDLAPPELTRLLVEEAGKRAAPSRGPSPAPPRERHNFSPSSRSRPPAEAAAAPSPEPREEKVDEYPPVGESGGRNQQRRAPFARLPRRRKGKGGGRGAEPAEAPTDRETTDGEPPHEPAAVPQEPVETTDAGGDGEQSDQKEYDALLQMLRDQLRAEPATSAEATQAPAPAVSDLDSQGRETAPLSKEEQARILDLFEARRLAEKAAGRHRKRSLAKKREKAERKLDRDYIKNEIHSAFQAQHDPGVRYYNSVAIRVHKGEKAVDAKTIEQVATAQAGKMSTRTKEERVMARRVA